MVTTPSSLDDSGEEESVNSSSSADDTEDDGYVKNVEGASKITVKVFDCHGWVATLASKLSTSQKLLEVVISSQKS